MGGKSLRLKVIQFTPAPIVVNGEKEDGIHGDIEPIAIRQIDGQGHYRELLPTQAGIPQYLIDHHIALIIG